MHISIHSTQLFIRDNKNESVYSIENVTPATLLRALSHFISDEEIARIRVVSSEIGSSTRSEELKSKNLTKRADDIGHSSE